MNSKFDGYLLVSDMDATLLGSDRTISEGNRKAIEYFTDNGGLFTVATGRTSNSVREYLDRININAPAILHNGAQIYDFASNKSLRERFIEEERKSAIKRVYEDMHDLGLEIYSNDIIYIYRECSETARFKDKKYSDVVYGVPDAVWGQPWTKCLLIGEKHLLDYYEPIYRRDYDSGYAVRSGKKYLDIVSSSASKGIALTEMKKMFNGRKAVAVGDNMNDISMLRAADISFAVENSEESVKQTADFFAPSNNEDAIAYIIDKLERGTL